MSANDVAMDDIEDYEELKTPVRKQYSREPPKLVRFTNEIEEFVRKHLADYATPKQVEEIKRIVVTPEVRKTVLDFISHRFDKF